MIDIQAAFQEAMTLLNAMSNLAKMYESDARTEEQKARESDMATAMVREHFASLINDVLADHTPRTSTHARNPDQSLRIICQHDESVPPGNFADEQGWRDHVSRLIANRLMKDQ